MDIWEQRAMERLQAALLKEKRDHKRTVWLGLAIIVLLIFASTNRGPTGTSGLPLNTRIAFEVRDEDPLYRLPHSRHH